MRNKKLSKTRSTKYEPLLQGILFVILGFIGLWLLYDTSQGGTWFISTGFSRTLYQAVGRNGVIFIMGFATVCFFVGGAWTIINAVIRLRKGESDPR